MTRSDLLRRSVVAALLAAVVGCSTGAVDEVVVVTSTSVRPLPEPATRTPSTQQPSTGSPGATATGAPSTGTSATGDSGSQIDPTGELTTTGPPTATATLDDSTVAWFVSACTGVVDFTGVVDALAVVATPASDDPATALNIAAETLRPLATNIGVVAGDLSALPPPADMTGADDVHPALVEDFVGLSDVLISSLTMLDETDPTDAVAVSDSLIAVSEELQSAVATWNPLESFYQLPVQSLATAEAVRSIEVCAPLFS